MSDIQKPIMQPDDPRWTEFSDRLDGPDGCNFHEKTPGDSKSIRWTCDHDHANSRRILADMGYDVAKSLEYFENHGGYCDCEVLFNVAPLE